MWLILLVIIVAVALMAMGGYSRGRFRR